MLEPLTYPSSLRAASNALMKCDERVAGATVRVPIRYAVPACWPAAATGARIKLTVRPTASPTRRMRTLVDDRGASASQHEVSWVVAPNTDVAFAGRSVFNSNHVAGAEPSSLAIRCGNRKVTP